MQLASKRSEGADHERARQRIHPGCVAAIWRYPVKSMIGEELDDGRCHRTRALGRSGLCARRRRIGQDHQCQEPEEMGRSVRVSGRLAGGGTIRPDRCRPRGSRSRTGRVPLRPSPDIDERLSDRLSRPVRLTASAPPSARAEGYWPDYHWLEQPDADLRIRVACGHFLRLAHRFIWSQQRRSTGSRHSPRRAASMSHAFGRIS